jgi:monoamine oxidase
LRFEPELPARHRVLCGRWRTGTGVKVHVGYQRPFWRDAGLSGQAMSDEGLVRLPFDLSADDGSAGMLVGFMGMPSAHDPRPACPARDPTERRRALLGRSRDCSARRLGSRRIT